MATILPDLDLITATKCLETHNFTRARMIAEIMLANKPRDPVVLSIIARAYEGLGQNDESVKAWQRCIAAAPNVAEYHMALGQTLSRMGRYADAVARFEKVRKQFPRHDVVFSALASVHETAGDIDKARALVEARLAAGTANVQDGFVLARIEHAAKNFKKAADLLEKFIPSPAYPQSYFFLLAKCYERLDDIDKAFQAFSMANQINASPFDLESHVDLIRRIINVYSSGNLKKFPRAPRLPRSPIYIAGRPRSGTTLLEKIFDAHPDLIGIGEATDTAESINNLNLHIGSTRVYPECMLDMDAADAKSVSELLLNSILSRIPQGKTPVDKSLGNAAALGFLQVVLPGAHVIEIRRNALDNCWGCFVENLFRHPYSTDLKMLGITHRLHQRIMQHWQDVLELPILPVDYESLVEDQESWSRKIINFCGLPWDDRVLKFYETKGEVQNTTSNPTLSFNQVRQPIYKTSVGRAKKFEKYLGPLYEGLEEGERISKTI